MVNLKVGLYRIGIDSEYSFMMKLDDEEVRRGMLGDARFCAGSGRRGGVLRGARALERNGGCYGALYGASFERGPDSDQAVFGYAGEG